MTDARLAADDPALQPLRINREPLKGKKVLITGIANKDSIAYGCARACKAFGADIAMTYLNDKTRQFTEQLAVALGVDGELYLPLDIQKPEQVAAMCATIQRKWGKLDVVLHAMAFAPMEALHAPVLDCPLDAFQTTMAVSVHSLIALSQKAVPLMTDGGSIFTLTYFGGDKVVPHYGIMGPAKSCLEGVVRYLAAELGPKGIRVNAISPGPLLTRAASGISHFDELMEMAKKRAPEHTLVTPDEIGVAMAALACDHMKKITGEPSATMLRRQILTVALIAGNRNIALFLAALPPEAVGFLTLFVAVYQIPMYVTPLFAGRLYRRPIGRDEAGP